MQKCFVRCQPVIGWRIATPATFVAPRVKPVAYKNGQPVVGAHSTRNLSKDEIQALPHFQEWVAAKKQPATDRQAAKYRQLFPGYCRVRVLAEAHGAQPVGLAS